MIQSFSKTECSTTGCTCCSCSYDTTYNKEKILLEARDNIRVAKEICEHYKISFNKFCHNILTPKKCKKHKFIEKYNNSDYLNCIKCNYMKPKKDINVKKI